jgi:LacI family transcriptional regulator
LRISQGTVRRALTDLAADGMLEKRPAMGTIVRKALRTTGLRNLAIFLPEYFSPNITEVLTRLNLECLNRHIFPQAIFTHKGEKLRTAYKQLKFKPQDGAVILLANSTMATVELTTALREKGYECICVDTQVKDLEQKYVGVDNLLGIEMGLDHLTSLGHKKIGLLVNEPAESANVQERIQAFESYSAANGGLDTRVYRTGVHLWENSFDAALSVMDSIWNSNPRPTALFAISDYGAIAAISWLQKREIKVPEEISILGFDGTDFGAMIHPALSSVANPHQAIADAVFELLDKKSEQPSRTFVAPQVVVRESTAAPHP